MIFLAISQEEKDALYDIESYTSTRFNGGEAPFKTGVFDSFQGVNFIWDQDLNVSGTTRTCIAWLKKGLLFGQQNANSR